MRIVLCENGLGDRQGHHFNLAAGMREEFSARGIPLLLLSHLAIEKPACEELGATPLFESSPYDSLTPRQCGHQVRACLRAAWRFGTCLRRVETGPDDVVAVLTARPAEILGLVLWSVLARARPSGVALNFITDDFIRARTGTSLRVTRVLYRRALGLASRRFGRERLVLTSASPSLAATIGATTGHRVQTAPVLHSYPPPRTRPRRGPCTIGFLGTPRPDKGEAVLAELIASCAASQPQARIVVQLPEDLARSWTSRWPANVTVEPVGLGRDRYFELLQGLDLVVLPYQPDIFGSMVSGVFAEATAAGIPTVVPTGTWMSEMVRSGRSAGVVADAPDVTAMADAIDRALGEIDRLRDRALGTSAAWRSEQSISAYVERLIHDLDACGDAESRPSGSLLSAARRTAGATARRVGAATRADVRRLNAELERLRGELQAAQKSDQLRLDDLERSRREHDQTIEHLKRVTQIDAVTRWISQATLRSRPLVSVILATYDRPGLLPRAIDSVLQQRYDNWELLVIEDGDGRESREIVQRIGDPRISWQAVEKGGVCVARNAGLNAAAGEIVTYLDDDNTMDLNWLYAVVWAFEQRPEADVLYGAFVIDDYERVSGERSGAMPWTFLYSWSRDALRNGNLADIGAIAHRAGLQGAWFDPSYSKLEDWDLLLRLTETKDPIVLPAIACYYSTEAPRRLTEGESLQSARERMGPRILEGLEE